MTEEAIRAHPRAFISGIAGTIWAQLWARRVFAPEGCRSGGGGSGAEDAIRRCRWAEAAEAERRPTDPRFARRSGDLDAGRATFAKCGGPPTEHPLVFDDPRDERRYAVFERDTDRLAGRIPTRDANQGLVHRLNQASNRFPPPVFWLAVGLIGSCGATSERSFVALALAAAGSWSSSRRRSWPRMCPSTRCPSRPPSCCLRRSGSSVPTRAGRYVFPGAPP